MVPSTYYLSVLLQLFLLFAYIEHLQFPNNWPNPYTCIYLI